ncbi:methyltransferase-domain-containing protein [Xylariomycetidae sp. FL0641]|nr:methyltransferase-domain-containing protein [Xylariomycetidae sp. FL0641]
MFAVKGWAVSSDSLKAENANNTNAAHNEPNGSKKRKRPSAPANVDSSNVADLWEQVIEGRSGKKPRSDQPDGDRHGKTATGGAVPAMTLKEKKKLRKIKQNEANQTGSDQAEPAQSESKSDSKSPDDARRKQTKKEKKRKSKDHVGTLEDDQGEDTKSTAIQPKVSAPSAPKLTPMQAAMREKLISARFRHLNETLYTKPSVEAFQLFADSPEMFQEYHEGFRRQVDVWPENPVDGYIQDIKMRGRQKAPHKSRHGQSAPISASGVQPLLRTNGVCTIADLGCGDAKLAEALQSEKKKLNIKILSFDLQSPSPLVTKADIANLPVEDGSVNVAIFCLALMGTNWLDFVEEAYRILHWKGELWVAEIKSRFGPVSKNKNKNAPVSHSVGNRRKPQGKKAKGKDVEPDGDNEADLAIVVDGAEDKRQETDVSAFVEALRKRGFLLQRPGSGGAAVDLRNKMFVKMQFVKAAQPSVGKGAVALKKTGRGGAKKTGAKFLEAEEQDGVDESNILKPCVYKIR